MYQTQSMRTQISNGQTQQDTQRVHRNAQRPRPRHLSDETPVASSQASTSLFSFISRLPVELMNLLAKGEALMSVMQAFIQGKETDEGNLTNRLFYALNPSIPVGSKISNKTQADQWVALRDKVIRPLLRDPSVSVVPHFREPSADGCPILDRRDPKRDLTKGDPSKTFKLIKKRNRDLSTVTGVVLHQMAFSRGNNVEKYLEVGAHFVVMHDGTIARLYPNEYYLNASNGFNPTTVAIEFAGNFPNDQWKWWKPKDKPAPQMTYVSPAQINAGRCLLQQLTRELPNLRHVFAHRQSSDSRTNDPGPDLWFGVGEWAIQRLGLTDIGTKGAKIDSGTPIAASWRSLHPKPMTKELESEMAPTSTSSTSTAPSATNARVPTGFKVVKRGDPKVEKGLERYAPTRLDTKLLDMRRRGLTAITDAEIDVFQRIANVETSGKIQGINTWDSAVVSSGFMQFTLQHGKMQEWIMLAPAAYKKYGIELDTQKYLWGKSNHQIGIKGAAKNDLRWGIWAKRFYDAGLDDAIILAEIELAKNYLQKHLAGLKSALRRNARLAEFDVFMRYYNASAYLRGLFQSGYNNLPLATQRGALWALGKAREQGVQQVSSFIPLFIEGLNYGYKSLNDPEGAGRLIKNTKTGANLP